MNHLQDPFGTACMHYLNGDNNARILVKSDFVEDDYIPVKHLFRSFNDMPRIEQAALELCKGKVLDLGAGAGSHSLYLQEKGFDVTALDVSDKACEVMRRRDVKSVVNTDFFNWQTSEKFDTILMMMNGIGLVGELKNLDTFFSSVRQLLNKGGQILLDSSDLCYLFDDEDTEDLPETMDHYYGEVQYQMVYKTAKSEMFKWLFIDPKMLTLIANKNNFKCEIVIEGNHFEFLAKLSCF